MLNTNSIITPIPTAINKQIKKKSNLQSIKRNYMLYVFLIPSLAYIVIFHYIPIYGIQLAFKDFVPVKGIWGSQWIGISHFKRFFESYQFWSLIKNTLLLSVFQLVAGFPIPIILALLLNYTTHLRLKKAAQTITYAPHFISTVVMVGMLLVFLSPRGGFVNQIIKLFGVKPIMFMGDPAYFRSIYVWSGIWQSAGWGSIIYMATLAGVSPELHEAAIVDGANKIERIWYIDIPALLPTAVILLILNVGQLLNMGFEKAFLMQNDINLQTSEIISTYVYKIGIQSAQYSYATAIGLFNNIINFILLLIVNRLASKMTGSSLW